MKLYENTFAAHDHSIARVVYIDPAHPSGTFKMTLHGNGADLIVATTVLVSTGRARSATIVDANTKYGMYARRITPDNMTFRRVPAGKARIRRDRQELGA